MYRILSFPTHFWHYRELWWRLTEREIVGRYKGSFLGILWSFFTPLAMLAVYTFVFSQVFKARWGGMEENGPLAFAVNLFAGLIVFNLFSDCISRAPTLVVNNPNYVKKVVFPLEILSNVALGTATFHATTSFVILIIFEIIAFRQLPVSILWIPLVWLPLFSGTLALTWVLAAAGVFIRDIGQLIGVSLNMLMFLSPIFYPVSALPEKWRPILNLNPIGQVIEQTRNVAIKGINPDISYLIFGIFLSIVACEIAFRIFRKSKKAFADVI